MPTFPSRVRKSMSFGLTVLNWVERGSRNEKFMEPTSMPNFSMSVEIAAWNRPCTPPMLMP